jgi:hypothetical protein
VQDFVKWEWDSKPPVQFQYSAGFIRDFKQRNRFPWQRPHLEQRRIVNDEDRAQKITLLRQFRRDVAYDGWILTVDDPCWLVHPNGCWSILKSFNSTTIIRLTIISMIYFCPITAYSLDTFIQSRRISRNMLINHDPHCPSRLSSPSWFILSCCGRSWWWKPSASDRSSSS